MKDDYIQEEDDGLLHIIEQEREKEIAEKKLDLLVVTKRPSKKEIESYK